MNKYQVAYVPVEWVVRAAANIGLVVVSRVVTIERRRTPRYDIEALLRTLAN